MISVHAIVYMQAQHASLTVKTVTYNVSPSPLRADPSQSHTINEFLHSCHSIQHGAALHEMPPLPPDVGISMENLLLDQICRLCQVCIFAVGPIHEVITSNMSGNCILVPKSILDHRSVLH